MSSFAKKSLLLTAKLLLAALVFGYLGWKASRDRAFDDLLTKEKHWPLFVLSWITLTAMISLQSIRWRILSNALGLTVGFWEAIRVGFIAHFGSQFMLGMVIGDAIRAGAVLKNNRGRLTDSIASTIFDRAIGLYGLLIVAATATLLFDLNALQGKVAETPLRTLIALSWLARTGTIAGTLTLVLLFVPGFLDWSFWKRLTALPWVGKTFHELLNAARLYRSKPGAICSALLVTLVLHVLGGISIHFAAEGLPSRAERSGLAADATVYILTSPLNALPIGAFDFTYNALYRGVSVPEMPETQGFVIVLAWRLVAAAVAIIGLVLFVAGKRTRPNAIDAPIQEGAAP